MRGDRGDERICAPKARQENHPRISNYPPDPPLISCRCSASLRVLRALGGEIGIRRGSGSVWTQAKKFTAEDAKNAERR